MRRRRTYPREHGGEGGWTDWIHPLPGYRFACCDCGLVHELELSAADGRKRRYIFRVRRNERATAAVRREDRKREGR